MLIQENTENYARLKNKLCLQHIQRTHIEDKRSIETDLKLQFKKMKDIFAFLDKDENKLAESKFKEINAFFENCKKHNVSVYFLSDIEDCAMFSVTKFADHPYEKFFENVQLMQKIAYEMGIDFHFGFLSTAYITKSMTDIQSQYNLKNPVLRYWLKKDGSLFEQNICQKKNF